MAKETHGTIGCPTCDQPTSVTVGGSGKAAAYCTECGTQVLTRTGIGSRKLLERAAPSTKEPEHEPEPETEEPEPAPAQEPGQSEPEPAAEPRRRRRPGRFI